MSEKGMNKTWVLTLRPFKFGTGTDKCVQIMMVLGLHGEF